MITKYALILLTSMLFSCKKWTVERPSRQVVITVINECYARITVYKLDNSIYAKETFDCDYEKEVYREFDKGIYRVRAETGFKTKELLFNKNDYSANLNIKF